MRFVSKSIRFNLVTFVVALMAGCASQSSSDQISSPEAAMPRIDRVSSFLNGSSIGETKYFETSPWGEKVSISIDGEYASAGGSSLSTSYGNASRDFRSWAGLHAE